MVVEREVPREELIGHLKCPHNLACRASISECRGGPGSGGLFFCLLDDARMCAHSLFIGARYLCKCPLRSYLREILRD
jgi:hypothetical protein